MVRDFVIVGAGLAGLARARVLAEAGAAPLVLERSYRPGGRLATRELGGATFDYGVVFVSSSDRKFLSWAKEAAGDQLISGWPKRVDGSGTPCQPWSLEADQERFALRGGLNQLAVHEAKGLVGAGGELRLNTEVTALGAHRQGIEVHLASGEPIVARHLVLALAHPQAVTLLESLGEAPIARAMRATLDLFPSVPCLVVAAVYSAAPQLPWDISYPEDSPLQLASHESSKTPADGRTVVVYQARPNWSAKRLEVPKETWSQEILAEAARLYGPWAATPQHHHAHRWKHARLDGSGTARRPLVVPFAGGTLTLAGELFSEVGGVAGAWDSGHKAVVLSKGVSNFGK